MKGIMHRIVEAAISEKWAAGLMVLLAGFLLFLGWQVIVGVAL